MRILLTLVGVIAIVTYSIWGAVLMNDWAVAAAAEMPLDQAIREMDRANQVYSTAGGIVFAAIGVALALAWGVLTLLFRRRISPWAAASIWAGILALGAPAYFFGAFSNLNSVGDTFYNWNAEAAFALEAPLFLVGGVALLFSLASLIMTVVKALGRSNTGTKVGFNAQPVNSP